MLSLNLPAFDAKIVTRDGKKTIYDILRKRYVALTPEEWVRQHFVHYLINEKKYPPGLMANEYTLKLNGMFKRCDTLIFRRNLSPQMMIEYKAPNVPIEQSVFDQIMRYNIVMHVDYLIVSNGMQHYCCRLDYKFQYFRFLEEIPEYMPF